MGINNLEIIKPLLYFNSDDTYYFLQLLQRKKEHEELGRNSNNIKNYYIKSVEHLESKMDEIIKLCNFFNARAYLRLTPRSYKKTALHHLQQMATMIADNNYKAIAKSYLSSSGSTNEGTIKRWIIDIDSKPHPEIINDIKRYINNDCRPYNTIKTIVDIPTKNGIHIITIPFDLQEFQKNYHRLEVHKDNPVNLYIP